MYFDRRPRDGICATLDRPRPCSLISFLTPTPPFRPPAKENKAPPKFPMALYLAPRPKARIAATLHPPPLQAKCTHSGRVFSCHLAAALNEFATLLLHTSAMGKAFRDEAWQPFCCRALLLLSVELNTGPELISPCPSFLHSKRILSCRRLIPQWYRNVKIRKRRKDQNGNRT